MLRPPFLRRALALGICLAGSLGPSRAEAQAPALTITAVRHAQSEFEDDTLSVDQINLKDCEENDYYTFTVHVTGGIPGIVYGIEVWASEDAGTDCSQDSAQTDSCREVAPATVPGDYTIDVYVRDIVNP